MTKTLTIKPTFILIGAIILLASAQGVRAEATDQQPGFFRRLFCKLTWNETISIVASPDEICTKVRQNIEYSEDLCDTWESEITT